MWAAAITKDVRHTWSSVLAIDTICLTLPPQSLQKNSNKLLVPSPDSRYRVKMDVDESAGICSPDLNPTKRVWNTMEKQLRVDTTPINMLAVLENALVKKTFRPSSDLCHEDVRNLFAPRMAISDINLDSFI